MIFKIDGLFFQLHSSLLVSSARCLHVLQGIIFTCLICSSGRCGSFFGSTAAVGDEYSRVVLGVDAVETDWRLFDIWDWRFDKLPVISAKLSLHVMGADASGKARCLSDFLSLPLRFLNWPLRFLSSVECRGYM
ncbi:hypothetical protein ACFX1Z_040994 [Malus domestica]